jgi:sec-independent protein translocase protein TatC
MAPTLLDHLVELRSKVLVSLAAIAMGSVFAHLWHGQIVSWLMTPLGNEQLFFLSPLDPLLFILKIDLLVGTLLALPVINWALLSFVRPALARSTWFSLLLLYGLSLTCAAASITYGFFVSVPAGIHFLMSLTVPGIENMLTATSYLRFLLASCVVLAVISQVPIVLLTGLRYGVFSAATIAARRGHVYLVAVVVLSILTPTTDPLNLLLILGPTALLFEGSLLIGRLVVRSSTTSPG